MPTKTTTRKAREAPPTPSESDYSDDYDDDDIDDDERTTHNNKSSNKHKQLLQKYGKSVTTKMKAGIAVTTKGVQKLGNEMKKLQVKAQHALHHSDHDNSDDDGSDDYSDDGNDDDEDSTRQRAKQKNRNGNNKQKHNNNSSKTSNKKPQRQPTSGKHKHKHHDDDDDDNNNDTLEGHSTENSISHNNTSSATASSRRNTATKPSMFARLFNRNNNNNNTSRQNSTNNSAANSDNEEHEHHKDENDIDIDYEDGDTSVFTINIKPKYRLSTVQQQQRCKQLQLWKQHIEIPQILPDNHLNISSIVYFRNTLLAHKMLVRNGLPGRLRSVCYEYLSGASTLPDRLEQTKTYDYWLGQARQNIDKTLLKEIKNDVPRVLKGHTMFVMNKQKQTAVKHILCAFCMRNVEVGYCNSMSHIVALLYMLYNDEQHTFWVFCALVDIILPPAYFHKGLVGCRADTQLLKGIVYTRLNKLHTHFNKLGIDINVLCLKWLMCAFTVTLPLLTVLRIWDILVLEGPTILIQVSIALLKIHEKQLLAINDTVELMQTYEQLLSQYTNAEELITYVYKQSVCSVTREDLIQRNTERKIMENQYLRELQHAQQRAALQREIAEEEEEAKHEEVEELMCYLAVGIEVYKIPYTGSVKKTQIRLLQHDATEPHYWYIEWTSKKKSGDDNKMKLNECMLFEGIERGMFHKRPEVTKQFKDKAKQSCSLISPNRSLDIVCVDADEYICLIDALKRVCPQIAALFHDTNGNKGHVDDL